MKAITWILAVAVIVLALFVVGLWVKVEGLEASRGLTVEGLGYIGEYITLNNQRLANDEQSISDLFASDSAMLDLIESILAMEQEELDLHRQAGQQAIPSQAPDEGEAIRFLATRRLNSAHCIVDDFPAPECLGGELYYRISGREWEKIPGRPWETWTMHLPDDTLYCFVDELAGAVLGESAVDQVCAAW
ncbi:hypothetical protein A2Y68_01280 [Candidatus Woesebacteria bacterium RBG_13_46_13]|uniref:Uncharacterized protein n=1 Tax=Candidatus Woesebacteria bacterium RBG_13_46_13 TaxID=1802479 RepID=A0A1F7X4S5_9BACT|nr:MAG: hypothetical protein A2Y68_01280 [Candidatus Woesebacteria bacterium RBG_13_46_13]